MLKKPQMITMMKTSAAFGMTMDEENAFRILDCYAQMGGKLIDTARIPVLPVTRRICHALSLDPLRLIGSGSMLMACADGERMVAALEHAGIHAAMIGWATESGCTVNGEPLSEPHADELYRLFAESEA